MLLYFPPIYDDELLYSIVARYHRHAVCDGRIHSDMALFGHSIVEAVVDLPGRLANFCSVLPPGREMPVADLIFRHTLLPYYSAYQSQMIRDELLDGMGRDATARVQPKAGITTGAIKPPAYLQFCPICFNEMITRQSEAWWRRVHQLPGVLICPDHEVALRQSSVLVVGGHRYDFVAATEETCPMDAPRVAGPWSDDAELLLLELARRLGNLLTQVPEVKDWSSHYRQALGQRGLMHGPNRTNRQRVAEAFASFTAPLAGLVSFQLVLGAGKQRDWLVNISCRRNVPFHPLHHVLFQMFLDVMPILPVAVEADPMRQAWPVTSPQYLAEVDFRRESWLKVCRAWPDRARIELKRLVMADYVWLKRHDREWLDANMPPAHRLKRGPPRQDWSTLDQTFCRQVGEAIDSIRATTPPKQVTLGAVERHMLVSGMRRRSLHMPLTAAVIAEGLETTADFHLRRLTWAKQELMRQGITLTPYRLRHYIHLNKGDDSAVEAALLEMCR